MKLEKNWVKNCKKLRFEAYNHISSEGCIIAFSNRIQHEINYQIDGEILEYKKICYYIENVDMNFDIKL